MKRRIPCEVYSRVVGYLRPVSDWNFAKQQEFADRVPYEVGLEEGDDTANEVLQRGEVEGSVEAQVLVRPSQVDEVGAV
jgi:hypothetical protein